MQQLVLSLVAVMAAAQSMTAFFDLEKRYEEAHKRIVTDTLTGYSNALVNAGAHLRRTGDLDGFLAIQSELERFGSTAAIEPALEHTSGLIGGLASQAKSTREERTGQLLRAYIPRLESLVRALMQADRIEDARVVNERLAAVRFALADMESRVETATEAMAPVPPVANPSAANEEKGRRLVLWNITGFSGERGTRLVDIALIRKPPMQGGISRTVWTRSNIEVPWEPREDTQLVLPIPTDSRFDVVRVEIKAFHGRGGGLAEIQVFENEKNIAIGRRATASASIDRGSYYRLVPENVTNGTTSGRGYSGYWQLPDGATGWVEVDLTEPR